ncbi:MAG: septum formation initiator family protein, partial [Planctomycetaceae bacterium]
MHNPQTEICHPQWRSIVVSAAFWLALFAAAGFYALVALSPKLSTYLEQRSRRRENQLRLVLLERQVLYLKRVERALQSDPEFAAELARKELGASRPGEETFPVGGELALEAGIRGRGFPKASPPWYAGTVRRFSEHRNLRTWTLIAAAFTAV